MRLGEQRGTSVPAETTTSVARAARPGGSVSKGDILAALQCHVRPVGVSVPYLLALLVVAGAMALLPLAYLALVGLAGYGVVWHAIHNTWIVTASGGGYSPRVFVAKVIAYLAPIVAGGIMVLFMLKPLLARGAVNVKPFEVSPKREPFLYNTIHALCRALGAPLPRRVWLCLEANAAAGLRSGLLGFLRGDVTLTVGLPFIAGMDLVQFLGVVAHEMGHLSQGIAMRCSCLIRSVNAWFARVVYGRDVYDVMLDNAASEADIRIGAVLHLARLAVWLSRRILWVLMICGHAVSCLLLRQMEFDADRYALRLIGSRPYIDALVRSHLLAVLAQKAYGDLDFSKPEQSSFVESLAKAEEALPEALRRRVEEACNGERTQLFDTHPAPRERIQHAVMELAKGEFAVHTPATCLFVDFEKTAGDAIRDQSLAAYMAMVLNKLAA